MGTDATPQTLLAASGPLSMSGVSAVVDLGPRDRLLRQTLAVTVATGTNPKLEVRLESCAEEDGASGWRPFGSFAPVSAPGVEHQVFVAHERFVRVVWTVAGTTPVFNFSVAGTRDTVYATLDDFALHGLPENATRNIAPSIIAKALASATVKADGKLAQRIDLPLESWDIDLTEAVAKIAGYDVLSYLGFNPESGADMNVRTRHNDAMKWLDEVAAGRISLYGTVDRTPSIIDDGVAIVTNAPRGWRTR